jgi:hypothetical protein
MRYLAFFSGALAALLTSPSAVGAQNGAQDVSGDEADTQQEVRGMRRWHPEAYQGLPEPSSRNAVLALELDEGGLDISPGPTPVSVADAKVKRAKGGLATSCVFVGIGVASIAGAVHAGNDRDDHNSGRATRGTVAFATLGAVAIIGGVIGIGLSTGKLRASKQELRDLEEARRVRSGRLRWDRGKSRFVF